MIQVKIYDRVYNPLTNFLAQEVDGVTWTRTLGQIGDASFTLRLDNAKVSATTIQSYNRVEISDNGVIQFSGYIVKKTTKINTVEVRCKEIAAILKKRISADPFTANGGVGDAVTALVNTMNGLEATGITLGNVAISTAVNSTFNAESIWSVLTKLAQATNCQFIVSNDRKLNFLSQIGLDKSASVFFRYNTNKPELNTILQFSVDEDGDNVVSQVYGKTDGFTSTQTAPLLQSKFGLLQLFTNFRVANNQADVDAFALSRVVDVNYSPALALTSTVGNFDIGDLIKVEIHNKIIDINDTFQVTEKTVEANGDNRKISVRINNTPYSIVETLNDIDTRIALLESKL